jgi:hypothetical protein
MNKALGIVALVAGLAAVGEAAYIASMRSQVSEMRDRIARVELRQKELAAKSQVARLEEQVAKVETDVVETKRSVAAMPAPSSADPSSSPAPAIGPTVSSDELAAMIDKKVEEKVKAQGQDNGFGGKKRPLRDVAKELEMPHEVEVAMAKVVNEAKQASFELLQTPRSDGTNLVDDLVAAFKSGEKATENVQQVFMRIFKENVPGTNETYFAAVLKISEEAMKKFETVLTPEQLTKYKHTGVGPLDLETGFDPFAEYMKK